MDKPQGSEAALTFRQSDHYNGGKDWFGYGGECHLHPRIYLLTRSIRATRSTEYEYSVDGEKVENLSAALERITRPPNVSDDEMEALRLVPDDWSDRRAWKFWPGGYATLWRLHRKGLVEADDGRTRRTDLGRQMTAAKEPTHG